jgi:hypothetical protein
MASSRQLALMDNLVDAFMTVESPMACITGLITSSCVAGEAQIGMRRVRKRRLPGRDSG